MGTPLLYPTYLYSNVKTASDSIISFFLYHSYHSFFFLLVLFFPFFAIQTQPQNPEAEKGLRVARGDQLEKNFFLFSITQVILPFTVCSRAESIYPTFHIFKSLHSSNLYTPSVHPTYTINVYPLADGRFLYRCYRNRPHYMVRLLHQRPKTRGGGGRATTTRRSPTSRKETP